MDQLSGRTNTHLRLARKGRQTDKRKHMITLEANIRHKQLIDRSILRPTFNIKPGENTGQLSIKICHRVITQPLLVKVAHFMWVLHYVPRLLINNVCLTGTPIPSFTHQGEVTSKSYPIVCGFNLSFFNLPSLGLVVNRTLKLVRKALQDAAQRVIIEKDYK